ncbi:MAG: Hsp70 family protein, partial [Geminicoccaceae bacterium]|nr:Hsp70 family protein [Geminicoccaceae bacterium]
KDKATGKEQQIRIQASGGLSETEIEKMVQEAQEHAEEDKKRRELIEARNSADSLVYSSEKSLKEHGSKVGESERQAIETAIAAVKTAMEGEDVEAINARTQELAQASMKLGEAMYADQSGGDGEGGGPDGGTTTATDDGVVDAEFEEVDEDKKRSA